MVVTLTGANDFACLSELKRLTASFIAAHGDFAVERYDGDEDGAARMRESITSMPFLTERKLVLLQEPSKQKAWAEHITDALKDVAESTDLVIIEPKLDKRLSYYKTLKKDTEFKEFSELDAQGLARWASEYAKAKGGSLSSNDARLLIDRLGPNQQMLQQELNKLLSYDPQISKTTIELLTDRLPQSTVFELLDAAFSGNVQKTFALYREQRALKVEPQAIIAMLAWQLHVLALVKTADNRGPETIAKEGKINPYVVRKTQGLARNLSLPKLKTLLSDLLNLDLRLKTQSIDADEALQLYLIRLAT
ncbi:MAG TPA: DNA polymerase III subunit delta [Bacillota bacterium]|nr:DNA polymerase III subunit delta [Bacillota bacterium]